MRTKQDKQFLPDFCSFRMVLAVFFLAELLAFLLTLAIDYSEYGFFSAFGIRSFITLWITLLSAVVLCSIRKSLSGYSHFTVGVIAFMLIQGITALICWLVIDVLPDLDLLLRFIDADEKLQFYLRAIGISSLVAIAFLRYLFVLFKWRQQVEAKAAVKLEALQARMRPHFLFNSLNSIACLTRTEPELAERLIEDLADLIRASMLVDHRRTVSLEEEIKLSKLYLNIELQRFMDRLKVSWEIDRVPKQALLPPLSLQPIIENAVYHGIELNPEGGEIIIQGSLRDNKIALSVRNTLPPSGVSPSRKSNQMAIDNLLNRLIGCFGSEGNIHMNTGEFFFQVNIEFPYRSA